MQWRLFIPGVICTVAAAGGLLAEHQAAEVRQERTQQRLHEESWARVLPASPAASLAALWRFISLKDTVMGCAIFSPPARAQFAAAHQAPTCEAAITSLANQVTDPTLYRNATLPSMASSQYGETGTADGCQATWEGFLVKGPPTPPGPLLGRLTLRRQLGHGFLITGYEPC